MIGAKIFAAIVVIGFWTLDFTLRSGGWRSLGHSPARIPVLVVFGVGFVLVMVIEGYFDRV